MHQFVRGMVWLPTSAVPHHSGGSSLQQGLCPHLPLQASWVPQPSASRGDQQTQLGLCRSVQLQAALDMLEAELPSSPIPGAHIQYQGPMAHAEKGSHPTVADCRLGKASARPGTKDPAGRVGRSLFCKAAFISPKRDHGWGSSGFMSGSGMSVCFLCLTP